MKMRYNTVKCLSATMILFCLGVFAPPRAVRADESGSPAINTSQSAAGLDLTLAGAVASALENNTSLQVQRVNPRISIQSEQSAKAVFDKNLTTGVTYSDTDGPAVAASRKTSASAAVTQKLHTGSTISLGASAVNNNSSASGDYSSGLTVTLTKPLLQGAGLDFNLVGVKQAGLNTETSYYQLQGYAEALVGQVVSAYWDYALAAKNMKIYEDSVSLAEQQLKETESMVEVGKLAEVEIVAAKSEVALRNQALIQAKSQFETLRLNLLRLINPAGKTDFWDTQVSAKDDFDIPKVDLGELKAHVETALKERADLSAAKIALENGDLDVVKTKNGLLPYLAFFVTLGNTGYANTFTSSVNDIFTNGHQVQFGMNYNLALGKRDEKARYETSLLRKDQLSLAIDNMAQTVQQDVRDAWVENQRSDSQMDATKATLALQEEKLRAETEKYRVGRSTALNVAIAQRDLLQSQVDDVKAAADYIKSLNSLYQAEGDLLEQYGIKAMSL